jgi:hypothetical protein
MKTLIAKVKTEVLAAATKTVSLKAYQLAAIVLGVFVISKVL